MKSDAAGKNARRPGFLSGSIMYRFIFILTLIAVVPLLIIGAVFYFSMDGLRDEYISRSAFELQSIQKNMDYMIRQIERISLMVYSDNNLQQSLTNLVRAGRAMTISDREKIFQLMTNMNVMRDHAYGINPVSGISIYTGSRMFYQTQSTVGERDIADITALSWYRDVTERQGQKTILSPRAAGLMEGEASVSLARSITNITNDEFLGIVVINLEPTAFADMVGAGSEEFGWIYVLGGGEVLYHSLAGESEPPELIELSFEQPQGSMAIDQGGRRMHVNYTTSQYSGITLVQLVPYDSLLRAINGVIRITIIVGVVCAILSAFIAVLLSANLARPIVVLNNVLKRIGGGEFQNNIVVRRKDEIGQLASGVKEMSANLQEMMEKTTSAQLRQKEAELMVLQSQINPHFLYNTLESIHMKAEIAGQKEISDMAASLGRLFKLSISGRRDLVPISEELAHMEEYLHIQGCRYDGRIKLESRLPPEMHGLYMLKFILQPLAENSIIHGYEKTGEQCIIALSGGIEGDMLTLVIEDNGIGMDETRLSEVNRQLSGGGDDAVTGIGLINVHNRIRLRFGGRFGLTVESALHRGTRVIIRHPVIRETP